MSNRLDLATTVNITSTYAGEFAGKYISAMERVLNKLNK